MPPIGLGEHGSLVPMKDHRRRLGLTETERPQHATAAEETASESEPESAQAATSESRRSEVQ
jgi:hypothetical protein